MDRMRNRVIALILALALVVTLLACGSGGLLSRRGGITPTPTKTPRPTFTATLPPTETPIPTDTPLPTDTPTPVPPTLTPVIMTATFTPAPTDTPSPIPPTATNTVKPTAKPPAKTKTPTPKPPPTNTPKPAFEFTGVHLTQLDTANCGMTGFKGTTRNRAKAAMPGVSVAIWTSGWEGTVSNPSSSTGYWEVTIDNVAKAGVWSVRVVDPATCLPKAGGGTPSANCTGWRSDLITVTTTAHCEGAGAVQVPVVDFTQN